VLLHLADADGPDIENRHMLLRQRRMLVARVLLQRLRYDATSPVARTLYATVARVLDALVREEGLEIFDVVIAAALHGADLHGIETLAEASMIPELKDLLRAYAQLAGIAADREQNRLRGIEALQKFADQLPAGTSTRVEAFRKVILDILRDLRPI